MRLYTIDGNGVLTAVDDVLVDTSVQSISCSGNSTGTSAKITSGAALTSAKTIVLATWVDVNNFAVGLPAASTLPYAHQELTILAVGIGAPVGNSIAVFPNNTSDVTPNPYALQFATGETSILIPVGKGKTFKFWENKWYYLD